MSNSQAASRSLSCNLFSRLHSLERLLLKHSIGTLLVTSLCLFLPLCIARLSLIDDHEIVRILTLFDDQKWLGIREFLLSVDFGDLPRFRPTYYFFRVSESILFRDFAPAWFAMRLVMAATFAVATLMLASTFLSPRNSLLMAVGFLSMPIVPDIFMRLGPGESYAAGLCALIIIAFVKRWPHTWLAASLCATLLVGIKENFLFLIPFQLYPILIAVRRNKRISAVAAACFFGTSLAFACVIALKLLQTHGVDVYGNSIQDGRLLSALLSLLGSLRGLATVALVATSVGVWSILRLRKAISQEALVLVPIAVLCLSFNILFYGEVPRVYSRYGFPFWYIFLLLAGYCGNFLLSGPQPGIARRSISRVLLGFFAVSICLGLGRNAVMGYRHAIKSIEAQKGINALTAFDSRLPILVHANRTADSEPIVAVSRFIDFYKGQGAIRYLIASPPLAAATSPFESDLNSQMLRKMQQGGDGYLPLPAIIPASDACIEAYFRREEPPLCDNRALIPY
ncbi:MAG: hypothetical protein PHQ05_10665 [Sterolibacterium sp.]|nr:hypothetical protein [Sterolibacterium sp.]